MGDLLEAKQNSVPFTGDKIICGSWWKCWGKCIFGIVGGAGLGGLGGAAGGSAVPVLGTIGGGIAGAIFGGISGASASCD